jgi:hypothetical protein
MPRMPAGVALLDSARCCFGGAAGAQRVRRISGCIDAGRRRASLDDQRNGLVRQARGDQAVAIDNPATTPANAAFPSFGHQGDNQGAGS